MKDTNPLYKLHSYVTPPHNMACGAFFGVDFAPNPPPKIPYINALFPNSHFSRLVGFLIGRTVAAQPSASSRRCGSTGDSSPGGRTEVAVRRGCRWTAWWPGCRTGPRLPRPSPPAMRPTGPSSFRRIPNFVPTRRPRRCCGPARSAERTTVPSTPASPSSDTRRERTSNSLPTGSRASTAAIWVFRGIQHQGEQTV
jgi:hypothetical protein